MLFEEKLKENKPRRTNQIEKEDQHMEHPPNFVVLKSTHHYVTIGLISVKVKTREFFWIFYDLLVTELKRERTSFKFYAGTDPDRFPPISRYKTLQLTGDWLNLALGH